MKTRTIPLLLAVAIASVCVAGTKIIRLPRATTFPSNTVFSASIGTGYTGRVTVRVEAHDLARGLGPWITNSGGGASSVTNAVSVVRSNGTAISAAATSLDFIEGTNVTIRATNAAGVVKVQINASGGAGEVTTVQLLASSNAVWSAQSARAPTNNALIGPVSSSGVALTLAALAGQDGNMLNVKDSSGAVIFAIAYDGQLVGVGANSARLASTSAAGEVWTASDTTGIGAFAAPAQQTNTSIARQTQITSMSNTMATATAGKQQGSFVLTNFALMGITNIVSANANTVITTNSGVLTLTTASGGSSAMVITTNANQFGSSTNITIKDGVSLTNLNSYGTGAVFFGHVTVASNITAQSFIGSGTGAPGLQLFATNNNAVVMGIANSNSVMITNLMGQLHKANAVYIELDCNHGNDFHITNRIAQNTIVNWLNPSQGQALSLRLHGAVSGGTDYFVTNTFPTGWLVANQSSNSAPMAVQLPVSVLDGTGAELNIRPYRLFTGTTNIAGAIINTYTE